VEARLGEAPVLAEYLDEAPVSGTDDPDAHEEKDHDDRGDENQQ